MATIGDNLARIKERMVAAARRAGRDPESVRLVAVSKTVAPAAVKEARAAGQLLFGENYLQEAQEKINSLGPGLAWHFIGHLQTNKAKQAAGLFSMIETVDRLKLARALDAHLAATGRRLPVLIQVNVGREPQKAGVLPEQAGELLREMKGLAHLEVRGLMTMPPFFDQPEAARPFFRALRQMALELAVQGLLGPGPVELSMGMSGDFEVAIEEGATLVRVGTALFGRR
ncbi:MAG: YggS family pyridoxal phosphate-dependent enzyme [Desulfobacteraceae bacterium]|nr:YggS family pyridoxal phosphate-dependent enzyme [Desulfobacteraceae bacterium]